MLDGICSDYVDYRVIFVNELFAAQHSPSAMLWYYAWFLTEGEVLVLLVNSSVS